jgi:hypothetical protein
VAERKTLLIEVLAAGTLVATSASATNVQAAAQARAATIGCESAADFPEPVAPSAAEVVVFDRVAVPRGGPRGLTPYTGRPARLKFFLKAGLLARRNGTPLGPSPGAVEPVEISIPPAWRDRAAIGWGDAGVSSTVRVGGCRSTTPWIVFTGGYYVRSPACVPVIVRVGARSRRIRVAVGRAC